MARLLLLFTLVPLVELFLLLWLSRQVGFAPTVVGVLLTGVLGAALAKREGLRVLGRWRQTLARGQLPEEGLLGAVLVLVGGVLLITPGVLTDLVGFALLIPASRGHIARRVRRRLERSLGAASVRASPGGARMPQEPFGRPDPGFRPPARREEEVEDAEVVEEPPLRPK